MKDIAWIENLYELGSPIRSAKRRIEDSRKAAAERLARAQKEHADTMAQLDKDAEGLIGTVKELWSRHEIEQARKGFMVVDGESIRVA